jgi:hypothetical protein
VKFNQLFKRLLDKILPVEKHSKVLASVVRGAPPRANSLIESLTVPYILS